jgi:hypothetical protein
LLTESRELQNISVSYLGKDAGCDVVQVENFWGHTESWWIDEARFVAKVMVAKEPLLGAGLAAAQMAGVFRVAVQPLMKAVNFVLGSPTIEQVITFSVLENSAIDRQLFQID